MNPSDTLTTEEREALADTQETTPQDGWRKSGPIDVTILDVPCWLRFSYRLLADDSWEIADIGLTVGDEADDVWPLAECHNEAERQVLRAIQHHMEGRGDRDA